MTPILAYARINARIPPMERGERFEDPLIEALAKNGFGEVGGAGTMQDKTGEILYCGIDVDLFDLPRGVPFFCDFLARLGAPRGSKLEYQQDARQVEVPFGYVEGLALYVNGTDLPDDVYADNDINDVFDEINRLLDDTGSIQGHWQGATETALYLYGRSADDMRLRIATLIATHPLCQKSRLVVIA